MPGASNYETIGDHGLKRIRAPFDQDNVAFIEPYLSPAPYNWRSFEILAPEQDNLSLNEYTVSQSHKAYVTTWVRLTESEEIGSQRLSNIRYRDMVLDNLKTANCDLKTVQFLGIGLISNLSARASIKSMFADFGRHIKDEGSVLVTPDHQGLFLRCLKENVFARGQEHMFGGRALAETNGAFIKSFRFISHGRTPGDDTEDPEDTRVELHMVTEIGRLTT